MLRTSSLLVASLLLSGTALAKKGGDDDGKIRVKLSTGLYSVDKAEVAYDGDDVGTTKTNTASLGFGGSRWQVGYLLGEGIELGAIVGYASTKGTFEPAEGDSIDFDPSSTVELAPYFAYNHNVNDQLTAYGEAHVGIRNSTSSTETIDATGDSSSVESVTKAKPIGIGAGVRIRVLKKASFDIGAEYEMSKPVTEVDGESDDKLEIKQSTIGLRTGLSIRF